MVGAEIARACRLRARLSPGAAAAGLRPTAAQLVPSCPHAGFFSVVSEHDAHRASTCGHDSNVARDADVTTVGVHFGSCKCNLLRMASKEAALYSKRKPES